MGLSEKIKQKMFDDKLKAQFSMIYFHNSYSYEALQYEIETVVPSNQTTLCNVSL